MKSFKLIAGAVGVLLILLSLPFFTERIDPGSVGIKVNLYGDGKGVDDVVECSGRIWFAPWSTEIHEFPISVQNAVYSASKTEGGETNDEIRFTAQDGLPVRIDASVNYRVVRELATKTFVKYRRPLDDLSNTIVRNYVRDAFNYVAGQYTSEEIYSKKNLFLTKVREYAFKSLMDEGFEIEKLSLLGEIRFDPSVSKSIQAKVEAKQTALRKEEEKRSAIADAEKMIEKARGKATSDSISAGGRYQASILDAKAIKEKQTQLTDRYLRYEYIKRWNGEYGTSNVFGDGTAVLKGMK